MESHASFWEAFAAAAKSLRGNKLRSFLTLLGIILATTTLIAVMSVIHGMDVYVAQNVSDMGADGFQIQRIFMTSGGLKKYLELLRRNPQLRKEEFQFLKERSTLVKEWGIESYRNVTVHYGKQSIDGVGLQGITSNIGVIRNIQVEEGRFLTEPDVQRRQMVCFIGKDLQDRFFQGASPVGKSISIHGRGYQVVGVAKAKGSVFGHSLDNFVLIPVETFWKVYGSQRPDMYFCATALDHEHLFQAQEEARMLLRAYRHLGPKAEDNFGMLTSDSLVQFWDQLTGAIAATAVGVVSVFMVVGGVVIMNIMLAVVTERTHEIGIRKSVGARRRDILNQFLVESAMLAAMGGLVGVAVAWVVAILVRNLTPVPMVLPMSAVAVGVLLSATVGLFFGIYPAQRAAKLDPIEALRVER